MLAHLGPDVPIRLVTCGLRQTSESGPGDGLTLRLTGHRGGNVLLGGRRAAAEPEGP